MNKEKQSTDLIFIRTCKAVCCVAFLVYPSLALSLSLNQQQKKDSSQEKENKGPGGSTTFRMSNDWRAETAFQQPVTNLSFGNRFSFLLGQAIFERPWVSAPASTRSADGLGPLLNANSCVACHIRSGRGHSIDPNLGNGINISFIIKLSILPQSDRQKLLVETHQIAAIPEPNYGEQLQDRSIQGIDAEGAISVEWQNKFELIREAPNQWTQVTLRSPHYKIIGLKYGPLHPDTQISPRVAPQLIGLGLLELIANQDIIENEDPFDENHDGISGRINWVWDKKMAQLAIGRFGWKAAQPTLDQQNQAAFHSDIGMSTPLFTGPHGDCTEAQSDCRNAPNGSDPLTGGPEISATITDYLLFYTRHLAVPARKGSAKQTIIEGRKIFHEIGCETCHRSSYTTENRPELAELSNQKIWPYTDMLLHDMGKGLADSRKEFSASGNEWRTPPLWGLSFQYAVSNHSELMHDGRARSLTEAILWHGGEAKAAKDRFRYLSVRDRKFLLEFLGSL